MDGFDTYSNFYTSKRNTLALTGPLVSLSSVSITTYEPCYLLSSISSSDGYAYGFNGQMKVNEWAGSGNWNTALFWEYDVRTTMRLNTDPKGTAWESPYSTFKRNPIWFSDRFGDSVGVAGLYKKDDNGQFKDKSAVLAFELYASTVEGKKYILDHAQKGFKLKGELVNDLNLEATEEGASSKDGIDIMFNVGITASGTRGSTSPTIVGIDDKRVNDDGTINRLKLNFTINSCRENNYGLGPYGILRDVVTFSHETFLHGMLMQDRYMGNNYYAFIGGKDHDMDIYNRSFFKEFGYLTTAQAQDILHRITPFSMLNKAQIETMMLNGIRNKE